VDRLTSDVRIRISARIEQRFNRFGAVPTKSAQRPRRFAPHIGIVVAQLPDKVSDEIVFGHVNSVDGHKGNAVTSCS